MAEPHGAHPQLGVTRRRARCARSGPADSNAGTNPLRRGPLPAAAVLARAPRWLGVQKPAWLAVPPGVDARGGLFPSLQAGRRTGGIDPPSTAGTRRGFPADRPHGGVSRVGLRGGRRASSARRRGARAPLRGGEPLSELRGAPLRPA